MALPADTGGPYVAVAAFCDRVLEEKDGVLSAIRLVDRVTATLAGPGVPGTMPPIPVNLTLLIVLKSGAARGRHQLEIAPEAPSGLALSPVSVPVLFEGEERGVNVVLNVGFQATQEGLYWFSVRLEGQLLTRIPLRVVYQPIETGSPTPLP